MFFAGNGSEAPGPSGELQVRVQVLGLRQRLPDVGQHELQAAAEVGQAGDGLKKDFKQFFFSSTHSGNAYQVMTIALQ
jgi:hypothetical protein